MSKKTVILPGSDEMAKAFGKFYIGSPLAQHKCFKPLLLGEYAGQEVAAEDVAAMLLAALRLHVQILLGGVPATAHDLISTGLIPHIPDVIAAIVDDSEVARAAESLFMGILQGQHHEEEKIYTQEREKSGN